MDSQQWHVITALLSRHSCSLLAAWKPNNLPYQHCTHFEDVRLILISKHTFPKVISFVELSAFLVTWITNALLIIQLLRLNNWFRRCRVIFIEAKRSMNRLGLNKQASAYVVQQPPAAPVSGSSSSSNIHSACLRSSLTSRGAASQIW
jgi:hypothetical protein